MPDHSAYQKKLISRYYDHRDTIMLTRLQTIVTDLALAESDKEASRLWKRAEKALANLKVGPETIRRLVTAKDPAGLAHFLRDFEPADPRKPSRGTQGE